MRTAERRQICRRSEQIMMMMIDSGWLVNE